MMKKQWKELVGLHNFIMNEIAREDLEIKEITKQLDIDVSNLTKEQVADLSDKSTNKELFIEDGLKLLKLIEPLLKKYNRLRRHIITTNAIAIADKKGNKILQSDDKGNYLYSINGKLKMEDEIEDLLDENIDFEPLKIDSENLLFKNKDFKILKEFI